MGGRQEEWETGCDTLMSMATVETAVSIDSVVNLAEDYADQMIGSMPVAESLDQLHRALVGSYISFLADALALARE